MLDELPQGHVCLWTETEAKLPDNSRFLMSSSWTQISTQKLRDRLIRMAQISPRPDNNLPIPVAQSRCSASRRILPRLDGFPSPHPQRLWHALSQLCRLSGRFWTPVLGSVSWEMIFLRKFMLELSPVVKKEIREAPSSVKFRFGNSQTLTSMKKVLLPLRTDSPRPLWLSLEIVRGQTPVLFSKRALRQFGCRICTLTDTCELTQLG